MSQSDGGSSNMARPHQQHANGHAHDEGDGHGEVSTTFIKGIQDGVRKARRLQSVSEHCWLRGNGNEEQSIPMSQRFGNLFWHGCQCKRLWLHFAPMTPTTYQLMLALQKLPNVADFCRRHDLPLRTIHRLRKRTNNQTNGGHEATESSRARIAAALKRDGLLNEKAKRAARS